MVTSELGKTGSGARVRRKSQSSILNLLGLRSWVTETLGWKIKFGSHQHGGCLWSRGARWDNTEKNRKAGTEPGHKARGVAWEAKQKVFHEEEDRQCQLLRSCWMSWELKCLVGFGRTEVLTGDLNKPLVSWGWRSYQNRLRRMNLSFRLKLQAPWFAALHGKFSCADWSRWESYGTKAFAPYSWSPSAWGATPWKLEYNHLSVTGSLSCLLCVSGIKYMQKSLCLFPLALV